VTAGFDPPPGDPEAIDAALTALGDVVSDLDRRTAQLETGFDQARASWKAPRAEEFTRAATGISIRAGSARASLDGAIDVVGTYARALREARSDIGDLARQAHQRLGAAQDQIAGMDDPESPDALRVDQHAGLFVAHLRDQADAIRSHVRQVALRAAAALDQATASVVPGCAGLSPDAIRQRVAAADGVARTRSALAAAALTEGDAWAVIAAAQVAAPPAGWRTWAEQYGLAVPEPPDLARGLELKAQLEQVLADSMALPPEDRADYVEDHFVARDGSHVSDEDLVDLALVDPALVGNLDGLPNNVRYLANKVNVFHAVAGEQRRLDAWQPPPTKADLEYVDYVRLTGRLATLTRLLNDQSPSRQDDLSGPSQILAFTPPAYDGLHVSDDGRLAVVVGDLDRARHVGIVVPGITNRIDNFGATFDKAQNTQDQAGPDSATVAWLGYDTPEFHDAVTDDDAIEGGRALHDFMAGLRRADGSDLTIMAHSYGTLVTSKALQLGKNQPPFPDRIVLFGSPGLGENVHSTADLGLPPDFPIYALRAPGDPVSITAAWGIDPVELPGITRLDTDWHGGEDVTGHSQYTDAGTDSLRNIAGVLAGVPTDQLQLGGNPLAEDGLLGNYNINLRNLVDRLQGQVPSTVQAAFAQKIEADLAWRIETGQLVPDSPQHLHDLLDLIRGAADDTGLTDHLTAAELHQAIRDAGFTDTLGDQVGDVVADWISDQDQLDGLDLPLGPSGFHLHLPDTLNESLGVVLGDGTGALTTHLSDWAVDHLPSLDTVLDAGDAVAGAWQAFNDVQDGVHDAWTTAQQTPGLVADTAEEIAGDVVSAGSDFVDGADDAAHDVWDTATGLLP
jgi:hypothetical protein